MLDLNFSIFPVLETERLLLRKLTNDDVVPIHQLRSDPEVNVFIDRPISKSIEDARMHIEKIERLIKNNECIYWAISWKDADNLIGTICFWNFDIENEIIEVGYELLPAYQRQGIILECIKKVIEYGFNEMKAKVITAFPASKNIASIKLLEKLNFKINNSVYTNMHEYVNTLLTYTLEK
jgi:ribosomal-protein-alanine N-acetyltransferase